MDISALFLSSNASKTETRKPQTAVFLPKMSHFAPKMCISVFTIYKSDRKSERENIKEGM